MKHFINPMVDCVFKAILGSEERKHLLIHFINAVLEPGGAVPLKEVAILNPYNLKEWCSDKLTIVDVKAVDEEGKQYQVEVHLSGEKELDKHILYTWSDNYRKQLSGGDGYKELHPVISIWLLGNNLFKGKINFFHSFYLYDPLKGILLNNHLNINILEVKKWERSKIENERDRWVEFFKIGNSLDIDSPPEIFKTKELIEAMEVLRSFSDQEREYDLYQGRLKAARVMGSLQSERDEAIEELQKTTLLVRELSGEREQLQKENALLIKALQARGIDPATL